MGLKDDLFRTLHDAARGDLGAVVGDAGRIVQGVSGGMLQQVGLQNGGVNLGTNLMPGFHGVAPAHPAAPAVVVPPPPMSAGYAPSCGGNMGPPPVVAEPRAAPCCDRYSLSDGFLVDGATGTVWKYQGRSNSFEEVPVRREKNKQALVDTLLETKLAGLRGQFEAELMGVADAKERQKQIAAFERQQLDPLRQAARSLSF